MPFNNSHFKNFKEARKFVLTLKLKSNREWRDYCKSGKKPVDIPDNPDREYRNNGWMDWDY